MGWLVSEESSGRDGGQLCRGCDVWMVSCGGEKKRRRTSRWRQTSRRWCLLATLARMCSSRYPSPHQLYLTPILPSTGHPHHPHYKPSRTQRQQKQGGLVLLTIFIIDHQPPESPSQDMNSPSRQSNHTSFSFHDPSKRIS